MPFLRLVRLPAVFTAFPDVLAGYVIVTFYADVIPKIGPLPALLAASACLYMAGMVLNDCFDVDDDATHRPERPIPSGQISLKAALLLGIGLMVAGLLFAMYAGRHAVYAAALLALSIWLYNGLLKANAIAACLGMGLCRMLNMLLGMTGQPDKFLHDLTNWNGPLLAPAGLLAFYVASVTMVSRVEESGDEGEGRGGRVRLFLLAGALGLAASLVLMAFAAPQRNVYSLATIALLVVWLGHRLYGAFRERSADAIRAVVKAGVLGIVLVDTFLIAGHLETTSMVQWAPGQAWIGLAALGAASLLIPAALLGRLMRVT